MQELNESTEQLLGPSGQQDFNAELAQAEATGDFRKVVAGARESHKFFIDVRDAVRRGTFQGQDIPVMAAALNMFEKMIGQAARTLTFVKTMEKGWKPAQQGPEQPEAPSTPDPVTTHDNPEPIQQEAIHG